MRSMAGRDPIVIASIIGYAALSVSLCGHFLAAKGDRRGWLVRVASGFLWLAAGILNGAGPYIACSVIYLALDSWAFIRRRRR